MKLSSDLDALVRDVLAKIPRLIALQDRDPDSPMRGSQHPAYWRDKSSEVADMRRQEAALAYAFVWRYAFPNNPYLGDREVLHACLRALGFWTREQHRDGTFDEWYKNEHGYATTAFSGYAVALTVQTLGEALQGPLREAVFFTLRRAGDWLARHDDWFKTNHQAVGVAALTAIGQVLGQQDLLQKAKHNADAIVSRMHEEGWSREISGLDVGYSFLLAEYLGMHVALSGDLTILSAIVKAYRFAADFLLPEFTCGPEFSICANPYFSRVATVLLSPHDAFAKGVHDAMSRPFSGRRDLSATLEDDLRLSRYAYQPLLAALLESGTIARKDLGAQEAVNPIAPWPGRTIAYPAAKLYRFASAQHLAFVSAAGGGLVRLAFVRADGSHHRSILDRCFAVEEGGHTLRNARYSLKVAAEATASEVRIETPLVRAGFVMPPFWARLLLRFGTSLPGGPRATRWAIDQWRRKKGTALNQSSAGIGAGKAALTLERRVQVTEDRILIEDLLRTEGRRFDLAQCFAVVDGRVRVAGGPLPDEDRRIPLAGVSGAAGSFERLSVRRTYTSTTEGPELSLEVAILA